VKNALRDALHLLKSSLPVRQWFGNLTLSLLLVLWLQVPDSHVWQFAFAVVSAVALVAGFFWLYCGTFQWLQKPASPARWWIRWLLLAVVIVAWWLLLKPIDVLREHETLYAGYWNSKLSAGLRTIFTYERILQLQEFAYDVAQLVLAAIMLPLAVEAGGSGFTAQPVRRVFRVYIRWFYWVAVLFCGLVGWEIGKWVTNWTPTSGVTGEIVSIIVRLGSVYTLNILLWCFVLALVAVYMRPREIRDVSR